MSTPPHIHITHDRPSRVFRAVIDGRQVGYLRYRYPNDASSKPHPRNIQID